MLLLAQDGRAFAITTDGLRAMPVQSKTRWKEWADSLRKELMSTLSAEVTKSVSTIASEVPTTVSEGALRRPEFWQASQSKSSAHYILSTAGFEITLQPESERQVEKVTLRLNSTWKRILQGVLDRDGVKKRN